jgi:CubicO group peptidase (beta-lactamase class C family)
VTLDLERLAPGERGLQVAACLRGELVADAALGDPGAVYPVFSVGKAVVALAVHVQATRGHLDLDAPISSVWPEFAAAGKAAITPRQVLMHRAGVTHMPPSIGPEQLADWTAIADFIARSAPAFPPGTNAYHPYTFGWILGELVRRTDGRPFEEFVQEELCEPLGADAFWFGIPVGVEPRVAELTYPEPPPDPPPGATVRDAVPPAIALNPSVYNRPDVHRAVIPATGAIADARSLARLLGGFTVLLPEGYAATLTAPRPDGADQTYGMPLPVGTGGLWITTPVAPGRRVLAHPGAGSSVAWIELDTGLSVAICHDQLTAVPPPEFAAIADAVRAAASIS